MMDTAVGTAEKDDPAEVANNGFDAMMKGEGDVVSGIKNKVMAAAANVTPAGVLAGQHRKMAEPAPGNDRNFRDTGPPWTPGPIPSPTGRRLDRHRADFWVIVTSTLKRQACALAASPSWSGR